MGRVRRPRSLLFDDPTFSVRLTSNSFLCFALEFLGIPCPTGYCPPRHALRADRSDILYRTSVPFP